MNLTNLVYHLFILLLSQELLQMLTNLHFFLDLVFNLSSNALNLKTSTQDMPEMHHGNAEFIHTSVIGTQMESKQDVSLF